jgi:hypothetical protein
MLSTMISPQTTSASTGGASTFQAHSAAVPTLGGMSKSVARTLNLCTPTPSAG